MTRSLLALLTACGVVVAPALARVWTDTNGKTLEAEFVRVNGLNVILNAGGKEIPVPLTSLSAPDQVFIRTGQEPAKAPGTAPTPAVPATPKELSLCGTPLKTDGGVTIVEQPLSPAALKSFAKATAKPGKLKLAIALPAGFDPEKPQRVMWTSAPINSEAERTSGNVGGIGGWVKPATQSGWVVVAADTDLGNPRLEDNQNATAGDLEVHKQAVAVLLAAWPKLKTWPFACCGFSGGSKATFYRAGDLAVCNLNVIGMFLGGCNQDMTAAAIQETRCSKADLKKIKVFISNGKSDKISTVAHAQALEQSTSAFYRKVRLELFEGGHTRNVGELQKAMEWFLEDEKPRP